MNVHPRKRYNNNGGSNNNYRRQNRHGGSNRNSENGSNTGNSGNSFGPPRPRKNFRALQEKYLNMAKEAMSSGDRILAEYYLQHADHYHRQNEEFLEERNKWNEQRAARRSENAGATQAVEELDRQMNEDADDAEADAEEDVDLSSSGSALPAFLTRKVAAKENEKVVPIQDWEE
jgi:hypothetical protein